MKDEQIQKVQKGQQTCVLKVAQKKSRKNKADISKASKSSHNTRRRLQPDSSQQNLLPQIIPQSTGLQPIVTIGIQNQLTKVLIRIPFSLLLQPKMSTQTKIHVQSRLIIITIQKQSDNITISSQVPPSNKVPITQSYKKVRPEQDVQIDSNCSQNACVVNFWGKYVYLARFQNQNKVIKKVRKELSTGQEPGEIIRFKLKEVNSDLFVYLNARMEETYTDAHNGLVNQGNTCYMNSYLQTLYHVPAFRNLVYEAQIQDQTKFPATLQQLFFHMEKAEKSVSPEMLVKSFGWGKKEASIQQDAQQFSCLFFEVLERKLNDSSPKDGYKSLTIPNMFKGTLNHYIRCKQVEFRNENFQQFIDLQLPIYPTLTEALDEYTTQVHMQGDNKYLTQDYGFQQAFKGVKIAYFPPVLMIQLKRFEYSFQQQKNIKILSEFGYQQQFDFSKWSMADQQNKAEKQIYQLYAVLVHQGPRAQSGHYYNFVRSDGRWFKCNDQSVQEVQKQKVFEYNFGGFHQSIQFDAKQMRVTKKLIESKTTAYMLVYIKKSFKQILMKQQNLYPEWIMNKIQNKQQMQQMKKNRKKFYHNVGVIDWERDLQGKACSQIGFLDQLILQKSKRIIEKISKQQKISQRLFTQNIIQKVLSVQNKKKNRKGSKVVLEQERLDQVQIPGIYLYYVTPQRQNLTGFSQKPHHSIEDLLKNSTDPIILKAPFQAKKQDYMCVVKKFKVSKNRDITSVEFYYSTVLAVPKQITYKELHSILSQKFHQPQKIDVDQDSICENIPTTKNFYIDDWKFGPIKLSDFSSAIPFAVPIKNQLLVCVFQQLPVALTIKEQIQFTFPKWYRNKKDTISLFIAEQKNFQSTQIKQMHISLTISDLRAIIFDRLSSQKKTAYKSAQNIVLKARLKKSSKLYSQVSESQFLTVKDLTKYQNRVEYCFSSLKVESRLSQYQVNFFYRSKDLNIHGPFQIIVHRDQPNQNLVKAIKTHFKILQLLKQEGQNQKQAQILLLTKDRLVINDIVNDQGKVLWKGQLDQVLKKQKNAFIVVEGRNFIPLENQTKIQFKQDDIGPVVSILLHHISQTYQRVGTPRFFKVDRRMELFQLKNHILNIIMDDYFGWQGKLQPCQPFKIKILLYVKDSKKTIDLTNLLAFEQMKRLRIQEKNINQHQNRKKSKDYKNSTRKASIVSDYKDNLSGDQSKKDEQIRLYGKGQTTQLSKQTTQKDRQYKVQNNLYHPNILSKNQKLQAAYKIEQQKVETMLNQEPDQRQDQKQEQQYNQKYIQKQDQKQDQNQEAIQLQQITQVQGPQTIYGAFPKSKVLKIQVIHTYLIRPNIALRLNVDD